MNGTIQKIQHLGKVKLVLENANSQFYLDNIQDRQDLVGKAVKIEFERLAGWAVHVHRLRVAGIWEHVND